LVAVTATGRAGATVLAGAWPGEVLVYEGGAAEALPAAFAECASVVAFLPTGVVVRLLAPHLAGKDRDPGVVCVDEGRRWAVALLGGHAGGANRLAERVADALGAEAVVTTGSDTAGLPGLDTLSWPVEGAVAAVGRALLDGEPVRLAADATWPLPPLPVGGQGAYTLRVTDRLEAAEPRTAVLRPPSLVVGVGASRGVTADEAGGLVDAALAEAGLSAASVRHLATIDVKAGEPGLCALAASRGWELVTHPATALAVVAVPNPSARVAAAVGTPSVAEAAAMLGGGTLVVPKRRSANATVAVARHRPRGRLALVGLGPGARDLLTPRAVAELRRASAVVGLDQYLDQVRDLLRPGTRVLATGLGHEEERARTAVAEARAGHAVALVGSGDAGVYAMAGPALELAGDDIDVVGVPGVTAALAAAALLGAPLGHDHAAISLSDLHTPWPAIEARVRAAAVADLVVTFYNPRSRGRDWQLDAALKLLREHRPGTTPVGIVRDASRPGERITVSALQQLDISIVDMHCVVVVGSSASRLVAGRFVTPRGYAWPHP
jgi:cobalt-precorrin 5A hydrolase/precorrin-3B C17-methyltransferase